jgi:hypothetical protein
MEKSSSIWLGLACAAALSVLSGCRKDIFDEYPSAVRCTCPSGTEEGHSSKGYWYDSDTASYQFYVNYYKDDDSIWMQMDFYLPSLDVGTYTLANKAPSADHMLHVYLYSSNYFVGSGATLSGSWINLSITSNSNGTLRGTFEADAQYPGAEVYQIRNGEFSSRPE